MDSTEQTPKDLATLNDQDVEIVIGGKSYQLRYTMGALRRLKKKLGRSMMGIKGNLLDLDEELLPELIVEGTRDAEGKTDLTLEMIDALPSAAFSSLVQAFNRAWFGAMPKKSDLDPAVKEALTKLIGSQS